MANSRETLKALLISANLTDEKTAKEYVEHIDSKAAHRLLEVLTEGLGGKTQNLSGGKGGFLTGLRKVVDSREIRQEADLPNDPRPLNPDEKYMAIEGFQRGLEKSDSQLLEGMELILTAKGEENLKKFAAWPGELSDGDFPVKVSRFNKTIDETNQILISKLKKAFTEQRIDMEALLKKHRSEIDEKE